MSGTRGVRPKVPVATTTLSHSTLSTPGVSESAAAAEFESIHPGLRPHRQVHFHGELLEEACDLVPTRKCHRSPGKSMPGSPSNFAASRA